MNLDAWNRYLQVGEKGMGFDSRRYLTRVLAKAKNLDLQVEYWSKVNAYNIIEETVVLMLIPEIHEANTWNATNFK